MATQSYQATEPLTDTTSAHVEAARQRAQATVLQQAYSQIKGAGTYTLTIGEALTPAVGKKAGMLTRTLTVSS